MANIFGTKQAIDNRGRVLETTHGESKNVPIYIRLLLWQMSTDY